MECGRLDSGLRWSAHTNNDSYLITYPSDEETTLNEVPSRCFENPLFVPKVLEGADLMKSESAKFEDEESVVYLSTSKAAKLERACRNAGFKKVCFHMFFFYN